MRTYYIPWLSLILLIICGLTARAEVAPLEARPPTDLPLTKIVLYSSGVGYFQRDGHINGSGQIILRFKVDEINDLLKSMIVQDFDGGQVTAVTYDSRDPIAKTLKSFAIDLTHSPGLGQLLGQIRGEPLEVETPNPVRGVILGVETKRERVGEKDVIDVEYLNLLTENGLRAIALPQIQHFRFTNERLNTELQQALAVLAAGHDQQKKAVSLAFDGAGQRRVRVAYITATPVWKTSYRLVLSDDDKPFLQGWALVENTSDEDWHEVALSLISGRPISFTMDMYQPLYVQRPVVEPEVHAALRPQVYGEAMEAEGDDIRAGGFQDEQERTKLGRMSAAKPMRSMAPAALSPPPATAEFTLSQGITAAAQATEVGELFEYTITAPVSLVRQKSAMLPIVHDAVAGDKLSIYNERVHAKHPLNGFRLRNATALHLMQGPITVFDGGRYAGDARLDDVPPGQERLISYAMDLETEVEPVRQAEQRELVAVSVRKGTLRATHKAIAEVTYNVKNRDTKAKRVLIEHPFRADWELKAPQTPAERTREVYRFAVNVEAGQGVSLRVREEKPLKQTIQLTNTGRDVIAYYLRATEVRAQVKEALQRVVALRQQLDETQQQQRQLEQRQQQITHEQERIRQNMGQLERSSTLYNRYIRKLDQQETGLETLQRELDGLQNKADAQRRELDDYLLGLDIE